MSGRVAPFFGIVAFSAMVGSVVATRAAAGTDPARSIHAPHAVVSDREGFDATRRPQATPAIFVRTDQGNVLGKATAIMMFFFWIRATLPRLRYDQLMSLGWKILLPLATANALVTAIIITVTD